LFRYHSAGKIKSGADVTGSKEKNAENKIHYNKYPECACRKSCGNHPGGYRRNDRKKKKATKYKNQKQAAYDPDGPLNSQFFLNDGKIYTIYSKADTGKNDAFFVDPAYPE